MTGFIVCNKREEHTEGSIGSTVLYSIHFLSLLLQLCLSYKREKGRNRHGATTSSLRTTIKKATPTPRAVECCSRSCYCAAALVIQECYCTFKALLSLLRLKTNNTLSTTKADSCLLQVGTTTATNTFVHYSVARLSNVTPEVYK